MWTGPADQLHGHVRILLHLTQLCICTQTRYQPYGPWLYVPESVWAQDEATEEEDENDDGVCCHLCGHCPGAAMCTQCAPSAKTLPWNTTQICMKRSPARNS